ncbi:phospho-2-dehydro-3-deoxyheptonate aldolase 1, chloroplastic-like [Silene latifolia]|uniref:phospho-2-dehydro-3-deoxyheptonate aldolase 1, chloroplastic-like n=1 Tax=Silene latifolia TaxID=37657 RepID=UPI003D7816FD
MNPNELIKLIDILNQDNKLWRITIITRMGAKNIEVKLLHLIRVVRRASQVVIWVNDPMQGNTIKAPCGLKTRPFIAILVSDRQLFFRVVTIWILNSKPKFNVSYNDFSGSSSSSFQQSKT